MMQEKVTTLDEAIGLINDGDVVALQNMATQAAPMALVRELIRQEKRDLGLVVLVGGMAVDWLAACRCDQSTDRRRCHDGTVRLMSAVSPGR